MRFRWQISGHKHERLILRAVFLLRSRPTSLTDSDAGVSANFAPHFAPSPAPVAQWIEQRFPKPQVACSTHAGGAIEIGVQRKIGYAQPGFGKNRGTCAHGVLRHGFFIVDFVSIRRKLSGVTRCNDRIFHYLNVKR